MTTPTTNPATDTPIDALPSLLALPGCDTAELLAATAQTYEYIPHMILCKQVLVCLFLLVYWMTNITDKVMS